MAETYSIEFCERAVKTMRPVDVYLLGKPLSHPFLALKEDDNVIGELHGTWSSASSNRQPDLAKLIGFWVWAASRLGSYHSVNQAFSVIASGIMPVNRVVALNRVKDYHVAVVRKPILSGDREQVLGKWDCAKGVGDVLDGFRKDYYKYADIEGVTNCQVLMRNIVDHSGLMPAAGIELQLADAGWSNKTDLIKSRLCL